MSDLSTFWESIGANALLVVCYAAYKVFDRCQKSKCKMDKESGFTFDLGDPGECAATDMARLGDLLKARSMHHLVRTGSPASKPEELVPNHRV